MIDKIDPVKCKMQNHLIQNYYIGNKKALFYNLRRYYEFKQENVFNIIPLTYHICKGIDDPSYA
jgi:tubulin monoglycylase TTLL3/8